MLDKESLSQNGCKLAYLLWLWCPLTSNWRCSPSHSPQAHGFRGWERMVKEIKVICTGNAGRFDLRPSGLRNALGSILTKRVCNWASGCSPARALVFRCNTHTPPNFRALSPRRRTTGFGMFACHGFGISLQYSYCSKFPSADHQMPITKDAFVAGKESLKK